MCSSNDIWKLGRLNHVAIATPNLTEASKFYKDVLRAKVCKNRLKLVSKTYLLTMLYNTWFIPDYYFFYFQSVSHPEDLPEHGVTTVFVELDNTKIELLHPLGA